MSINSQKDKIDVKNAIIEMSNAKARIEAEQEYIKETKKRLKDDHDIDGKMLGKLLGLHHKQSIDSFEQETDDVITMYHNIFG